MMLTVISNNTTIAPDKSESPTPSKVKKRLTESIHRGVEYYPGVQHIRDLYLDFDANGKVVGACALGFGILGEFGDWINSENVEEFVAKYEDRVLDGDEGIICSVLNWNDDKGMSLVEILERIASD